MMQRGRKSGAALGIVSAQLPALRAVPEANPPPPPEHLGEPERQIWRHVFADYELAARVATAVLTAGLEAHQRARSCREAIAMEGMTVKGRDGQARAHPLLAVERDARQAFLSAIKALGLEL